MVVDIHTHTFPERIAASTIQKLQDISHTRPFADGTEAGLRASMVAAGVDFSLVLPVATSPRQVVHINDASARLNSQGNGILSFGCMHPDFDGWKEELGRVAALGMKGIKVHPVYQGVDFDDPRYLRILDRCGELGLIVLTHAGLDIGFPGQVNCSPEMVPSSSFWLTWVGGEIGTKWRSCCPIPMSIWTPPTPWAGLPTGGTATSLRRSWL